MSSNTTATVTFSRDLSEEERHELTSAINSVEGQEAFFFSENTMIVKGSNGEHKTQIVITNKTYDLGIEDEIDGVTVEYED